MSYHDPTDSLFSSPRLHGIVFIEPPFHSSIPNDCADYAVVRIREIALFEKPPRLGFATRHYSVSGSFEDHLKSSLGFSRSASERACIMNHAKIGADLINSEARIKYVIDR